MASLFLCTGAACAPEQHLLPFLKAGDSRLGEEMGVTPKEAAKLKQEFLESMPGVAAFLEKVVEDCRQTGEGDAQALHAAMLGRQMHLACPPYSLPVRQLSDTSRALRLCRRVCAGYVETLAGRRCPLPNINLQSWRLRGEAERKAVNTPMQVRQSPAACSPTGADSGVVGQCQRCRAQPWRCARSTPAPPHPCWVIGLGGRRDEGGDDCPG